MLLSLLIQFLMLNECLGSVVHRRHDAFPLIILVYPLILDQFSSILHEWSVIAHSLCFDVELFIINTTSFILFTVVVVHPSVLMLFCKCNYSFFYSSKNQYHVYQHPKISMRAKNKIPRCNVDTHHSVYELQRSSVIIFMSWSHALMSTILVKLANFVLIMSNF